MTSAVWGFSYGGLINSAVMQRVGMAPSRQEVALLPSVELTIAPLVNLVPRADAVAHGLLLVLTHREIDHVYGQLKATCLPYPVVAFRADGLLQAALCYIVPDMPSAAAERDHVLILLGPAEALGFPDWYLNRIRSFLPMDRRHGVQHEPQGWAHLFALANARLRLVQGRRKREGRHAEMAATIKAEPLGLDPQRHAPRAQHRRSP